MKKRNLIVWLLFLLLGGLHCGQPSSESSEEVSATLIRDIVLIDGTGSAPRGADILIRGDRIDSIGSNLSVPDGAQVVEGTGKYVVPGLIDTHVHLDAPTVFQLTPEEKQVMINDSRRAFLFNGVTSVLNVSSTADWIWAQRKAQREGTLIAPRIYAMGRSFSPDGGWGSRHGGALSDAEAARERAQEYIAAGTDGFKIIIENGLGNSGTYVEMPEDMLEAITEVARAENVPMYVHAINIAEYRRTVEKIKPRAIIHGLEDRIPEGDPIFQQLVENQIAVVPTVSLFEAFLAPDPHAGNLDHPILEASIPTFLLEKMRDPEFVKEENRRFKEVGRIDVYEWARKHNPIFRENVTKMHQAGVKLAIGTDAGGPVGFNFQGYNTPWELKILVEAGLTPLEAIVAATRNGAEVIGVADQLGTIEQGKLADLLILSADPLENIENIRQIDWVMQGGVMYARTHFAYRAP
jgi:imidazolonepropionase-like amidohydrolase